MTGQLGLGGRCFVFGVNVALGQLIRHGIDALECLLSFLRVLQGTQLLDGRTAAFELVAVAQSLGFVGAYPFDCRSVVKSWAKYSTFFSMYSAIARSLYAQHLLM